MGFEDAKADVKKTAREVDEKTKEAMRKADGEESISDHVANLGDDIRNELGNAGDEIRATPTTTWRTAPSDRSVSPQSWPRRPRRRGFRYGDVGQPCRSLSGENSPAATPTIG